MQATIPSPQDAVPLESLLCVSCHWDQGSWCLTKMRVRTWLEQDSVWEWSVLFCQASQRGVNSSDLFKSFPVSDEFCQRVRCPRSLSSDAKVERGSGACRWKFGLVYIERVEAEGALYGTCDHRPQKPQNTLRWYLFVKIFWFFFPFLSSLRPALRRMKIFYWKENIR